MILTQFYRGALAALITVGAMQAQGYFFDDFSSGLIDWDTTGDVGVEAEEAVLRDGQATFSLLYQPVPLPLGTYTIEVDVRHDISPVIPTGQLPDVFFASMYFVDDPSSFDLLGGSIDGPSLHLQAELLNGGATQSQADSLTRGTLSVAKKDL